MKNLTPFLKQCIVEVLIEPVPQPPRKIKGLRSLVKHCVAEVIVEPDTTAEMLRERVKKSLNKRVRVVGNPKNFNMSSLIKECTLEVLKERVLTKENLEPTSEGPNIAQENPYPEWNAKMSKLEGIGDEGGIADAPEQPDEKDIANRLALKRKEMAEFVRKQLEVVSELTDEDEYEKIVRDLVILIKKEIEKRRRNRLPSPPSPLSPSSPPEDIREENKKEDAWTRYSRGYKNGKADKAAKKSVRKGLSSVEATGYHDGYHGNKSSDEETVNKTIKEIHHIDWKKWEKEKYGEEGKDWIAEPEPGNTGRMMMVKIKKPSTPLKTKSSILGLGGDKNDPEGRSSEPQKLPEAQTVQAGTADPITKLKNEVYRALRTQGFRQLGDPPRDYMEYYLNGFVTVSMYVDFNDRKVHVERYYDSEMVDNMPGHHINAGIPIPPQYDPNFVKKIVTVCIKLKNESAGDESIFGGIDDLQERAPTMEWKCPNCKKKTGILLEVESPADYVAFADCDHCGKEISDPKLDKAIYEVVIQHYKRLK